MRTSFRLSALALAALAIPSACAVVPPSDEDFANAFARVTLLFDS